MRPNIDEWLAERRKVIGASDAAAVLGQSPWRSPYAVWAEKAHNVVSFQQSERMRWGLALEPAIADAFNEWATQNLDAYTHLSDTGNTIEYHPDYPFIGATLDRVAWDGDVCLGPVELKTADGLRRKDWEDEPPLQYQIQVQHQIMVTGAKIAWIAVLIGGNEFRVYECLRNDKFIALMLDTEIDFWKLVETKTAPPVSEHDGSQSTTQAIAALHPDDNGLAIELSGDDWREQIEYLHEIKEKIKELQYDANAITNQIKATIADATYAHVGDFTYSFKTQTRKAYTVAENKCRVLRCAKRKETTT